MPVTASSAGLTFGPAVKVFEGHYFPTSPIRGYDVTRDGQRFLIVKMDRKRPLAAVGVIVLVQNWTRELREKVCELPTLPCRAVADAVAVRLAAAPVRR